MGFIFLSGFIHIYMSIDIVTGEPNIQCRQLYNMNVYKSKTYSYLTISVNAIIVITPKAIVNGSVFKSKMYFPCNFLKSSIIIIIF